jgi:hypothetical protein
MDISSPAVVCKTNVPSLILNNAPPTHLHAHLISTLHAHLHTAKAPSTQYPPSPQALALCTNRQLIGAPPAPSPSLAYPRRFPAFRQQNPTTRVKGPSIVHARISLHDTHPRLDSGRNDERRLLHDQSVPGTGGVFSKTRERGGSEVTLSIDWTV